MAETPTAAACSKLRRAGLAARWSSGAEANSAKAPEVQPKTSSPGLEARDAAADRLDGPGDVRARNGLLRATQAGRHAHEEGAALHDQPVADVDRRGVDAHEHVVDADDRPVDLAELEDVLRAVVVLDDRFHGTLLSLGVRSRHSRDGLCAPSSCELGRP